MIYLASPYSSPIVGAQQHRFDKVRRFTIHLFNQGLVPFSPIVYAHEMAKAGGLRTDAQSWLRFNSDMLRNSEAMFVYCLPGWRESKGVITEIKQAQAVFIPLTFFDEEFNMLVESEAI
jgi:hypothetical protein